MRTVMRVEEAWSETSREVDVWGAGVAPKCNAAALALSSPSTPGLWCQRRSVVLWHHKPGVLGLVSASAAALHFGATPPTRLPNVYLT